MIEVTLSASELRIGAMVGCQRQIEALDRGLPDKHGFDGLGWDVHVEGALGEIAAAKALCKYWGGTVNTFKVGGDVGELQVRTRSKHYYDLLVRDSDRDEDLFILVTGTAPKFWVHGYIYGRDAKKQAFQQAYGNRPLAYFVPKDQLTEVHAR